MRDELRRRREAATARRDGAEAALREAVEGASRDEAECASRLTRRVPRLFTPPRCEQLLSALELAHAALLVGDSSADGVGPRRGEGQGCRWMTREVLDAHVALAALAHAEDDEHDDRRRRAAMAQLCVRTESLGVDRSGRRYWALDRRAAAEGGGRGEGGEGEGSAAVWAEPRAAAQAGWWELYRGSACAQLAKSLDPRGVRERALQLEMRSRFGV